MAETYQDRFIEALFHFMADKGLQDRKDLPEHLDISYMTLIKIIDRSQKPTVQQCVELCMKGGYSANWLFLGIGEMKMSLQASMNEILVTLRRVHKTVHKP
jgi:hypothetical protein